MNSIRPFVLPVALTTLKPGGGPAGAGWAGARLARSRNVVRIANAVLMGDSSLDGKETRNRYITPKGLHQPPSCDADVTPSG